MLTCQFHWPLWVYEHKSGLLMWVKHCGIRLLFCPTVSICKKLFWDKRRIRTIRPLWLSNTISFPCIFFFHLGSNLHLFMEIFRSLWCIFSRSFCFCCCNIIASSFSCCSAPIPLQFFSFFFSSLKFQSFQQTHTKKVNATLCLHSECSHKYASKVRRDTRTQQGLSWVLVLGFIQWYFHLWIILPETLQDGCPGSWDLGLLEVPPVNSWTLKVGKTVTVL